MAQMPRRAAAIGSNNFSEVSICSHEIADNHIILQNGRALSKVFYGGLFSLSVLLTKKQLKRVSKSSF